MKESRRPGSDLKMLLLITLVGFGLGAMAGTVWGFPPVLGWSMFLSGTASIVWSFVSRRRENTKRRLPSASFVPTLSEGHHVGACGEDITAKHPYRGFGKFTCAMCRAPGQNCVCSVCGFEPQPCGEYVFTETDYHPETGYETHTRAVGALKEKL